MKLLLTGRPGIGKTTVIQKVLQGIALTAGGFFTQEMREGGRRVGFCVNTLDGKEGILAHIAYKGRYQVGRYGVNVSFFEAMALPELEMSLRGKELIVIDEIGKMELFSQRFRKMVKQILDQKERHLLGVIQYGGEPFVASIKRRRDVDVISVTHANRDGLPSQIITRLQKR